MFFTTAGLLAGPVLGLLDLRLESEQVKLLAEITLTLVLFADASRISLRALRREFAVPLRLLGIGLPLTIVAGALVGRARDPRDQLRGGVRARDRARLHRRRARPGGRLRRAHPVTDPAGPQRRERAQRRALRPALLHRDRGRRDRRRHVVGARRTTTSCSSRSATGSSAASPAGVARGARAALRRRAVGLIEPHWLQILTRRLGAARRRHRERARRQHLHRRVHRRLPVRRAAPRRRRRGHLPRRRGRRALQRGHLHRLRRGHPRPGRWTS